MPTRAKTDEQPLHTMAVTGAGQVAVIDQAAKPTRRRRTTTAGDPDQGPTPEAPKARAPRREQQRSIDTRQVILEAALSEFAQRGFEAASIRTIGARTGLQHPLITYHYRSKEILWKAVAENAFTQIRELWNRNDAELHDRTPLEQLREEYYAFLRFTIDHPDFHHFMLRENQPGNPRLPWLVEAALLPTMQRLLPQIEAAQQLAELPAAPPALIHYLMIGIMTVLSSLKEEIAKTAGMNIDEPAVIDAYLGLVDALVFRPAQRRSAAAAGPPARPDDM